MHRNALTRKTRTQRQGHRPGCCLGSVVTRQPRCAYKRNERKHIHNRTTAVTFDDRRKSSCHQQFAVEVGFDIALHGNERHIQNAAKIQHAGIIDEQVGIACFIRQCCHPLVVGHIQLQCDDTLGVKCQRRSQTIDVTCCGIYFFGTGIKQRTHQFAPCQPAAEGQPRWSLR